MKKFYLLILLLGLVLIVSGCSNQPVEFTELYEGDLEKITKIHITDGGSGHTQELATPEKVNDFLNELSDVTFTPTGTDADDITGVLYGVGFYEKDAEDPVFTMTTNIINEKEYKPSKDLGEMFQRYFELGEKVD